MTATLPTEAGDWAADWRASLRDRPAFAEAADGFDAAFCFEIRPDDAYDGDPVRIRLVVEDGDCTAAGVAEDPDYDFALRGPYGAWKDLLRDDLDVAAAVMGGPFDVEGSTAALMRNREAIAELVRAARAVDAEFAY